MLSEFDEYIFNETTALRRDRLALNTNKQKDLSKLSSYNFG